MMEELTLSLKITGSDVFGGLHELSVKSTEPEEIILNQKKSQLANR